MQPSSAGEVVAAITQLDGWRQFSPECEVLGAALAAAWNAGDWCEQFEDEAKAVAGCHRQRVSSQAIPREWSQLEPGPPGIAWLNGKRVFVRRQYDSRFTDEAHRQNDRMWHGEPDLQAWSFQPTPTVGSWLSRWKIRMSPRVEHACFRDKGFATRLHDRDLQIPSLRPRPQKPGLTRHSTDPMTWKLTGTITPEITAWLSDPLVTVDESDGQTLLAPDESRPADCYAWALRGLELGITSPGLSSWATELETGLHKARFETPTWDFSRALEPSSPIEIPTMTKKLHPHQLAAVEYLWKFCTTPGHGLNGDEMGLGKTAEALACAEYGDAYPLLIVCPAGLTVNWAHECHDFVGHRSVDVCTTRSGAIGVADITVIGYEALGKRLSAIMRTAWAGAIVDEAHYIKNNRATRSINVKLALAKIEKMRLAMSGTFVKNRNKDADFPLLVVGRDDVADAIKADRENQSAIMRGHCMIRRKKIDVMPNLPPLQLVKTYVDPDPNVWVEYLKAETQIIEYVKQRAAELAKQMGKNPTDEAVKAAMRAKGAEELVRMSHLRRLSGLAKKQAATELAQQFIAETGRPLILFAHHRDVLEVLARALRCPLIYGGMSAEERTEVVGRFQGGEISTVAVSFMAGGVGITLTAASDMMLLEQEWTPADMDQAYQRAWGRINDPHGLVANHLIIEGSIDEMMLDLIDEKREMASHAMDGEKAEKLLSQSIAGDVLVKYMERE